MIPNLLFYLYLLLLLSGFAYGLINLKRLRWPLRLLCGFLGFVFLMESATHLCAVYFQHNLFMSHFTNMGSIVFYTLIFHNLLSGYWRWITLLLGAVAFSGSVLETLKSFMGFAELGVTLLSFQVLLLCIVLFAQMLKHPVNISLRHQYQFWFATGSLVFYSVTFPFFMFYQFTLADNFKELNDLGYHVLRTLNFVMYGCYLYALIVAVNASKRAYAGR